MSEPPVEVSTADVRSYMNEYMTQDFISSRYYDILDSDTPGCIDADGALYIRNTPKGGGFAFTGADTTRAIAGFTDESGQKK